MVENRIELKSKALFHSYLSSQSIHWENGDEPPDYWLTYHGTSYAVEVTSSTFYRETLIGEGKVNENTFIQSLNDYADRVEREALQRGILNGVYGLYFRKPISDTQDNKYKKKLLPLILKLIETTFNLERTERHQLLLDGIAFCELQKVGVNKNAVYPLPGVRGIFLNAPENDDQILQLLQYAVDDKKYKLRGTSEPKILLYYDTYYTSTSENYLRIASRLKNIEAFHSVYVIIDGEIVIKVYGDGLK